MRVPPFLWMSVAGSVACSASDAALKLSDTGSVEADASSGGGFDTGTVSAPAWWRLDASLVVAAGQLSASGSELTVHVIDDDAEVLCSETFRVASTDTQPSQPDPTILTWWSLERGEGTGACLGLMDLEVFPSTLYLGVGEMHPELEAVAGQVDGLPEAATTILNGAYARVDPDVADTWVFGFAGDSDAWAGLAGPATVAPLADGVWTLTGVYGFPLP